MTWRLSGSNWWSAFIGFGFACILQHNTVQTAETFIATECFGSVLSLSCERGHRIKVLDDFFGLNVEREGPDGCQYVPGDCTVTNNRYTSVIHRYCEGKQTCTSFQVDRSTCGTNQTNYEQVEYECVPDDDVLDICTPSSFKTANGYIATPNFPNEYPPNLHCGCSMDSLGRDSEIQLDFTHFIVKYDYPCKDWVELELAGQKRRLCGAYRSTLLTRDFNLTFHSDHKQGHQGLWLHFSVFPKNSDGQIKVDCGPRPWTPTTTAPATTTPVSRITTTNELIILYEEAMRASTTRSLTLSPDYLPGVPLSTAPPPQTTTATARGDGSTDSTPDTPLSTTPAAELAGTTGKSQGDGPGLVGENETGRGLMSPPTAPAVTRTKVNLAPGVRNRLIPWFPDRHTPPMTFFRTTKPLINTVNPTHMPYASPTTTATSTSTSTQELTTTGRPIHPSTETVPASTEEPPQSNNNTVMATLSDAAGPNLTFTINQTLDEMNSTAENALGGFIEVPVTGIVQSGDGEDYIPKTDPRLLDELRRRTNRTTGIIIISICVGGIVLLVIILGVLLCVNKRRKPPAPVNPEKNKKDKIQQRLNSLSFYDSIPMFDSVGRKAGMGLATATVEQQQQQQQQGGTPLEGATATTTNSTISSKLENCDDNVDPARAAKSSPNPWKVDNGPYWTGAHGDGDSDHDSAVYAELDKHSKEGHSEGESASAPDELDDLPTYAVQLKTTDKNEDVYTHV